jgi:hypothetical protein
VSTSIARGSTIEAVRDGGTAIYDAAPNNPLTIGYESPTQGSLFRTHAAA